jgi:ribosomal protein S14
VKETMRYTFRRDRNKRIIFRNFEQGVFVARVQRMDQSLNVSKRLSSNLKVIRFGNKGMRLSQFKNHCVITARSAGILSKFGFSRVRFRELGNSGFIPGLSKSSW